MKSHVYWIMFLLTALLTACSDLNEMKEGEGEIKLCGQVESVLVQTKTGGSITGKHTGTLDIGMVRRDVANIAVLPDFTGAETLAASMTCDGSPVTPDPIEFNDSYQTFKNSSDWVCYASWYPYMQHNGGTVTFDVDCETDIMYGDIVKGKESSPFEPVTFNHALTKFKVWVYAMVPQNQTTGDYVYDPDAVWGKLTTLTVEDVPESFSILLPSSVRASYDFSQSGNVDKELTLPFGAGTMLPAAFPLSFDDRKAVAEFMIPPTSMLSLKVLTSKMEAGGQTLSIAKDFEAGCHYDVILRFSDHGLINADVKVGEWGHMDAYANNLAGNVFYDLSESETANCYVVSSANYSYCFNATVKGNGPEGIIDGTDVTLAADHAKILWADRDDLLSAGATPGFILMDNGKVSDGRVLFSVKGNDDPDDKTLVKEGNVLLGVYDAEDNLLWTWHIWMCDPPQRQGYMNGFSVHDRDLGAVGYSPFSDSDKDIDGLYYQWGRPTPFTFRQDATAGPIINNTAGVSLNERIRNPRAIYNSKLQEDALPHLWGWRSVADEYVKTIYDPCPPGYRVPSNRLWRELKLAHEPHVGENGNFHAIHFKVDTYADIFYPVSGYYWVNGDYLSNVGYSDSSVSTGAAYMWAATYDQAQHNPYSLKFERTGVSEVGDFTVDSEELHSYYALPVRCVSRKSTPHVEDLSASQTANSYMVTSPGYYKFNVGVRGNGISKLVSPGTAEFIDISEGLSTDISGSIVKLKYLWWQEEGGAAKAGDVPVILDNEGMVKDGYVMFHIDEFREGNLIVAGYDESESVILWTWHLWLTDSPELMKSHNFTVMDRNLGATFAPESNTVSETEFASSVGLYYQWSRKDPFVRPGEKWYLFDSDSESWELHSALYGVTDESAEKTVSSSVQNPMRFHQSATSIGAVPSELSSTWADTYDKLENQCFSTYRLSSCSSALWGYSSASGLGKTTTKTMYDPCPPGYCVTFYTVWTNDYDQYYTNRDSGNKTLNGSDDSVGTIVSGKGIFVSAETFDETWYPLSGYIDSRGTMRGYETEGRFHSSTPGGLGSRSLYYTGSVTGQAVSSNYKGMPSSYAYPVRCQKQ